MKVPSIGGASRRGRRLARRLLGVPPSASDVDEAARRVAHQQRQLELAKERLGSLGQPSNPVGSPWILLDYERAPIKIVASAYKRRTAASKEPFTVSWLEESLRAGDTLYDIGANIGAYSLIAAAIQPKADVVAFEPAYHTHAALCDNVVLNELSERITPLPVTLGRRTELGRFRHSRLAAGAAQHDSRSREHEPSTEPVYDQPVLVFALDDVIRQFELPPPTHVKLDVDGAEADVLAGAAETLAGEALRSMMVELTAESEPVVSGLEECGFRLEERHETPLVWYGRFAR